MALEIYRIVVHGQFADLGEDARELLGAEAAEHEPSSARFTRDGHLTYDPRLVGFSFRFEIREQSDDAAGVEGSAAARDVATDRALAMAASWMEQRGIGHSALRTRVSDMADVWKR